MNQMHIDDFTRFMPNGLDTYRWRNNVIDSTVGERGVGISGGQKQV